MIDSRRIYVIFISMDAPLRTNKSRYFRRIRNWCLRQEFVAEEFPWGCIVYKVRGKVFAICNAEPPLAITLKPETGNVDAYLYHPDIEIASHVGRFGWVSITAHDKSSADLTLMLVKESYRVVRVKHEGRKGSDKH